MGDVRAILESYRAYFIADKELKNNSFLPLLRQSMLPTILKLILDKVGIHENYYL